MTISKKDKVSNDKPGSASNDTQDANNTGNIPGVDDNQQQSGGQQSGGQKSDGSQQGGGNAHPPPGGSGTGTNINPSPLTPLTVSQLNNQILSSADVTSGTNKIEFKGKVAINKETIADVLSFFDIDDFEDLSNGTNLDVELSAEDLRDLVVHGFYRNMNGPQGLSKEIKNTKKTVREIIDKTLSYDFVHFCGLTKQKLKDGGHVISCPMIISYNDYWPGNGFVPKNQ